MRTKAFLPGYLSLVATLLFCASCTLFEKDIDAEVQGTFFVNETTQGVDIQYADFISIDAKDDNDIRDNLDKIKEWSVESIGYSLNGFSGDPSTVFSGSMRFNSTNASSGTNPVNVSVQNVNLKDLSESGSKQKLNLSGTELATIAGWFDAEESIEVYMQGTLSQAPTAFNLVVYVKLKVTASVL